MKNQKGDIELLFSIVILLIMACAIISTIALVFIGYSNEIESEIVVKEKFIKNNGESGKYLIVDSENNTYEITDLFFRGKWNSTDIYNQLQQGKDYKIKTTGMRIPLFSMYPNINEAEEIN